MIIEKIETADGTLEKVKFVRGDEEDFKSEIKAWLQANYPDMTFQEFFERLGEFTMGICSINMG